MPHTEFDKIAKLPTIRKTRPSKAVDKLEQLKKERRHGPLKAKKVVDQFIKMLTDKKLLQEARKYIEKSIPKDKIPAEVTKVFKILEGSSDELAKSYEKATESDEGKPELSLEEVKTETKTKEPEKPAETPKEKEKFRKIKLKPEAKKKREVEQDKPWLKDLPGLSEKKQVGSWLVKVSDELVRLSCLSPKKS